MAIVLALVLLVVALVAARDLYVFYARPGGSSLWLAQLLDAFRAPNPLWVGIGGAIAVLIGLSLLVRAFLPRRKTHRPISGTASSV